MCARERGSGAALTTGTPEGRDSVLAHPGRTGVKRRAESYRVAKLCGWDTSSRQASSLCLHAE